MKCLFYLSIYMFFAYIFVVIWNAWHEPKGYE